MLSQPQAVGHVRGEPSGRSLLQQSSVAAGQETTTSPASPFDVLPLQDGSALSPPAPGTSWPPGTPSQAGTGSPPGSVQEGATRPPPPSSAFGLPPSATTVSVSTFSATDFFTNVTALSSSASPPSELVGPPPPPPPPNAAIVGSPPIVLRPRRGSTQLDSQNAGGTTSEVSSTGGEESQGGGPPSLGQQVSSGVLPESTSQSQATTSLGAFQALLQGR